MIGRDHASCSRHVVNHEDGIAGNMSAHVAGYQPRVGIVTAAGGKTDNESYSLAIIKIGLRNEPLISPENKKPKKNWQHFDTKSHVHSFLLPSRARKPGDSS